MAKCGKFAKPNAGGIAGYHWNRILNRTSTSISSKLHLDLVVIGIDDQTSD